MCNGANDGCDIPERYEQVHNGIMELNEGLEEVSRLFDDVIEQRRKEREALDRAGFVEQMKRAFGW